ncbi:hypothetical protein CsSME_00011711 [Camellia sinensis var. sinensis]
MILFFSPNSRCLSLASAHCITSLLLNGKNFAAWSRSLKLCLGGKGKSHWLLMIEAQPPDDDPKSTALGLSVAKFFGYLLARREELTQYEPLSDFPVEAAPIILNTSPMPSLYEAFATIDSDEHRCCLVQSAFTTILELLVTIVG